MRKKKLFIIFTIISVGWIFGTNFLVESFAPPHFARQIEQTKELLYVLITGLFFYFYILKSEELNVSKEEERRLSTLINSMVDVVIFKDGEGRWIEANEFGLKTFKLEDVDYRGKTDADLAEYTPFYRDALLGCIATDEETWNKREITRVEENIPSPDGTIQTFDTIKVPLFHADGSRKGFVLIGRDITERKHVKKLLEESEQRYRSLFDYNPDIVYMIDLKGHFANLNPQFEETTGYKAEEIIGQNVGHFLAKQDQEELRNIFYRVVDEQKPEKFELQIHHKQGHLITLQCASVPMIINGEVSGIIGYGRDITQIRETEKRLRRTEKLSVVGELSASVAHEIRNPLTSLKGFVQLLKMEDEKHHLYYRIMLDELDRINHIVSELLLLAKPQKMKYKKASIENILNDVISLLKPEASLHNIQIEFEAPGHQVEIECEPNQLKQLFINIIKNAIEASNIGDTVSISLNHVDQDVSIVIQDKGCGISKERLKRIGEPFYSSKEKGTGLGLTVSFKIVQSHNGKIQFNSEAQQGTVVTIDLPVENNHSNTGTEPASVE
ncbi:PAS domain S-box protein [Mesobacillus maritimus]|uniref:PAS domain-containing sensor histidine kinase n=1 Tax=Mesobacillus maritimus TaxID=1643336 RepID=UPI00203EAE64|nr:PAS domain-containing sensor histidine kinase [Mesobacillus maritimus]MCM3585642.1 PAS domain S-box protein [Mesobacillus maritimus]MCM3669114.1 PAS domain S-box protein [Mesobacillus maritimus]